MGDMCANVEWVVCAAKGKLLNQGKTIQFAVPPGSIDGNMLPTYREYRSNIMRWSAHYEIDILAWTYYSNEICFLSELCDNADELWTLKVGEPWVCKHSAAGEERLRSSLQDAYKSRENSAVARMLQGGHSPGGGHVTPGGGHGTTLPPASTTTESPPESSTTEPAAAGTDFLAVENGAAFMPGDVVIINKGLPNEEQQVVKSVDGNHIFFESPLQFDHAAGAVVEKESTWVDPCATVAPVPATTPTTAAPVDPCAPVVPEPTTTPATAAPADPCAPVSTGTVTPAPPIVALTTTKVAWMDPCAPTEVKDSTGSAEREGVSLLQRATNLTPLSLAVLGVAMAVVSVGALMRARRQTRVTFNGRSVYQQVGDGEQIENERPQVAQESSVRPLSARDDDSEAPLLV